MPPRSASPRRSRRTQFWNDSGTRRVASSLSILNSAMSASKSIHPKRRAATAAFTGPIRHISFTP